MNTIKLLTAGTAATLSSVCPPIDAPPTNEPQHSVEVTTTIPAPMPPCDSGVVLLFDWDVPLNCDLNPPQILGVRIDMTVEDLTRCDHSGGQVMHDDEVPATYCIDLDY